MAFIGALIFGAIFQSKGAHGLYLRPFVVDNPPVHLPLSYSEELDHWRAPVTIANQTFLLTIDTTTALTTVFSYDFRCSGGVGGKHVDCIINRERDSPLSGPLYTEREGFTDYKRTPFFQDRAPFGHYEGVSGTEMVEVGGRKARNQTIGAVRHFHALDAQKDSFTYSLPAGYLGLGHEGFAYVFEHDNDFAPTPEPYLPLVEHVALQQRLPGVFSLVFSEGTNGSHPHGWLTIGSRPPHHIHAMNNSQALVYALPMRPKHPLVPHGIQGDWKFKVDGVMQNVKGESRTRSIALDYSVATIDTTHTGSVVPNHVAQQMAHAFHPPAIGHPQPDSSTRYEVACDARVPDIALVIKDKRFEFCKKSVLRKTPLGTCELTIVGRPGNDFFLGVGFLKKQIAIFNARHGTITFQQRAAHKE